MYKNDKKDPWNLNNYKRSIGEFSRNRDRVKRRRHYRKQPDDHSKPKIFRTEITNMRGINSDTKKGSLFEYCKTEQLDIMGINKFRLNSGAAHIFRMQKVFFKTIIASSDTDKSAGVELIIHKTYYKCRVQNGPG